MHKLFFCTRWIVRMVTITPLDWGVMDGWSLRRETCAVQTVDENSRGVYGKIKKNFSKKEKNRGKEFKNKGKELKKRELFQLFHRLNSGKRSMRPASLFHTKAAKRATSGGAEWYSNAAIPWGQPKSIFTMPPLLNIHFASYYM